MRIPTGIEGLDVMLRGGFIAGRNIMLSGPAGSGKTTFAIQFIHNAAKEFEEPALYVTLEESKEKIYADMMNFKFNLKELEAQGKMIFVGGPIATVNDYMMKVDAKVDHIIAEIEEIIKKNNIRRVVIDSINLLTMIPKDEDEKRIALAKLCNTLSSLNCTSILLSETREGSTDLSRYGIEEFIVDGVIVIYHAHEGSKFIPGIAIRKMRGTDHDKDIRMFKITDNGITIYPDEVMFGNI